MKRTSGKSDRLRQLLIADRQASLDQWNARRAAGEEYGWPADRPPMRDRLLEELKAGVPVFVGASDIMCALMHAGLPHADYVYDGKHGQKLFLLDEFDRLTEYVDEYRR